MDGMRGIHPLTTLAVRSYDPSELKALIQVFDEVWASLAADGFGRAGRMVAQRNRLASIVLALSHDRQLGASQIARTAGRLMRENALLSTIRRGP